MNTLKSEQQMHNISVSVNKEYLHDKAKPTYTAHPGISFNTSRN